MTTKKQVVEEFRCRAIRDAAMRVVGRKGLEKATVDDIAREAGVQLAKVERVQRAASSRERK